MIPNRRRIRLSSIAGMGRLFATATASLAQNQRASGATPMDGLEITNAVNRIAILSDLRDWETVRACLQNR